MALADEQMKQRKRIEVLERKKTVLKPDQTPLDISKLSKSTRNEIKAQEDDGLERLDVTRLSNAALEELIDVYDQP